MPASNFGAAEADLHVVSPQQQLFTQLYSLSVTYWSDEARHKLVAWRT